MQYDFSNIGRYGIDCVRDSGPINYDFAARVERAYMTGEMNGWVRNIAAKLEHEERHTEMYGGPSFRNAAKWFDSVKAEDLGEIKHYNFEFAVYKSLGIKWRQQYQKHGTCVGQGWKKAIDAAMAIIAVKEGRTFRGRACVAGTYAGGRVDVGGQPGSWDGSDGILVAKWITGPGGGLLLKHVNLPEDSLDDDENLARAWTRTREGVPKDMEGFARELPFDTYHYCKSADEVWKALAADFVVTECSSLIPTSQTRNGYNKLNRSGGHCMRISGRLTKKIRGFVDDNSWSDDWAKNDWNQSGEIPPGAVVITDDDMERLCSEGDVIALGRTNNLVQEPMVYNFSA